MVTEAWFPADPGPSITTAGLKRSPLDEMLGELGFKLGREVQEISAESADTRRDTLLKNAN